MITRRDLLARAAASSVITPAFAAPSLRASLTEDNSLRAIAAARGILFGTATATYEFKDADFAPLLVRDAGVLVAEYEMKRNLLEPAPGKFDFAATDALLHFAQAHGMKMRGHPLVWYYANPPWLADVIQATKHETLLTAYIASVAGHCRGRMHSWDVVNEALLPSDGRADAMRNSPWLSAFGPGYIDIAFHAARAADPGALLVYNDWGCEAGAPDNDRFRAVTLKFLDGLLARRVPIDALGLQGHLSAFGPQVDQKKLRAFLNEIQARGLQILVTELDVDDADGPSDIARRDAASADACRRFLDCVLDTPATTTVLTWGLSDRYLDAPDWRERLKGYVPRKLPYDRMMQRKPLWQAIARSLESRRV